MRQRETGLVPVAIPSHVFESPGRRRVRGRRRWARLLLLALLILAVVLGLLAAAAVSPSLAARRQLEVGRGALEQGQRLLVQGRLEEAVAALRRASTAFSEAYRRARHPALVALGWLPLGGRTPDAITGFSDVGRSLSAAGLIAAEELAALPGGLAALAPRDGRLPLEHARSLLPAVTAARRHVELAAATAGSLPQSLVPQAVASSARLVQERVDAAIRMSRAAEEVLAVLPRLAGASGPRRYFVALQNPAELRGTGGFIGLYSVLKAERGRFELAPFRQLSTLIEGPPPRPSSLPLEAAPYSGFGTGYWRGVNAAPDVPMVASFIESLWARTRGRPLDGVVFLVPQVLPPLLEAGGDVRAPGPGPVLTPDNVVPFTTNRAYFVFRDPDARKEALGRAAEEVLERFLSGTAPVASLRALLGSAAAGHIRLHATDPVVQEAFRAAGVSGEFGPAGEEDFLGVVLNNTAANKVDYYLRTAVRYEVTLGPDGTASARVILRLENEAPPGRANEALGPFPALRPHLGPGDTMTAISVYCARDCEMRSVGRAQGGGLLFSFPQRNRTLFLANRRIDRGRAEEVELVATLGSAWRGDGTGGVYRLVLQAQPLIRPMEAVVVVRAPRGMRVGSGSGLSPTGPGTAVWRGPVTASRTLELRFEPPPVRRAVARLRALLGRPLIRL